jgi:hypothetical protein
LNPKSSRDLLQSPPTLLHLGIEDTLGGAKAAGTNVVRVEFLPPAGGDLARIACLRELFCGERAEEIKRANQEALRRFLSSQPQLVDVKTAREVIPGMEDDLFLHAGPPISWERMSGPLRGAILGGLLLEKRASSPEEAGRLATSGKIRFEPCHHHHAVGPMAGLITPSMPVWILEDAAGDNKGNRTFCTLNEGLGKVLRYGAYGPEVLERLHLMANTLAPLLSKTLAEHGPVDLRTMMAQALQMGDEGHNRNRAGTSLLFRELAPHLVKTGDAADVSSTLAFIHKNDHFFLNLSMPMAKCMLMAAEGVPLSTLVTVMARNGTDFGIQVSSLPGRWFVGPAQKVRGLFFPGFSEKDANPDIGDSAITETAGIGGFAMAAAPAIVQFVGGSAEEALQTTRTMERITLGKNSAWAIPSLGFSGTPTGIDVRKVEEQNLLPVINTGIAHRDPGIGQVGAGLVHPPWDCFHQALLALAKQARQQAQP